MKNIAVTGGIASGKSRTSEYLKSLGYTVIDADEMSRTMTEPGGKAIPYIREHFGPEYLDENGGLDRAAMRDLVFKNPEKLRLLEAGTTDVVIADIEKIREERASAGDRLMFYDIPLLYEKNLQYDYDAVWVITADRNIRKERLYERDGMDDKMAELIMDSQEDEDRKVEAADFVIYNNGSLTELYRSVDDAIQHYL